MTRDRNSTNSSGPAADSSGAAARRGRTGGLLANITEWMSLTDTRTQEPGRQRVQEIMQPIYARGDRLMSGFVLLHLLLAVGFAFVNKTWDVTCVVSCLATIGYLTISRVWPRSMGARIAAGLTLQTFVMLHIYQLHGATAVHFLS